MQRKKNTLICCLSIIMASSLLLGCSSKSSSSSTGVLAKVSTDDLYSYMDPFIGTGGHVHTFPGATYPFGMIQLSPDADTKGWDWCAGYHYSDTNLKGFSHNHLSGTGWSDLGDILLMPGSGKYFLDAGPKSNPDKGWRSRFSHKEESASPGYYQVKLLDSDVNVELTANKRVGFHRYTYSNDTKDKWVVIDPTNKIFGKVLDTKVEVIDDNTVSGYCHSTGWGGDRYIYFTAWFSESIKDVIFTDGNKEVNARKSFDDKSSRVIVFFDKSLVKPLEVKVAISGVSQEGANNNLILGGGQLSFDEAKSETVKKWHEVANIIEVSGGTESQRRIFYSGIYHNFIAPNLWMDTDGSFVAQGKVFETKEFTNYSTFSTWDTFRGTFPLLSLIRPNDVSDMVNSLISRYRDSKGHIPLWELLGHDNTCMIGNPAIIFIYDAIQQKVPGIDPYEALEAMVDLATHNKISSSDGDGGLEDYMKLGYVPATIPKSVSKTLEYAYADWCVAELAKDLGETLIENEYRKRALSYKSLFNNNMKRFWPKDRKGQWIEPFETDSWKRLNKYWVSGNVWAYDYFVPHQMAELIKLKGGTDAFEKDLDILFTTPLNMKGEQHVDISGFIGGYAHGDEPGHSTAYLYDYVGAPYKTQKYVRQIMSEMYNDTPDGMINNEDCGQMSAWYIFSAMGFYPVTPGSNQYVLGSPIFDHVKWNLPNGKHFEVVAHGQSADAIYVDHVKLNGQDYNKLYITTDHILSGSKLEFFMSAEPNKTFGNGVNSWPQ
ncbi:GH92 family glycosyl hydrolase [Halosquirtibacter xylanolyticus]|uniref:GH92 family glycosyl hydrolase n=1 Tax=Halosquirtibacter xylanolyticus TaxID=3374599 RepID=UPI003749732E|nr:GH92 family glycosyl hydrolase [Prolixibacteraceae bacterium]